MILDLFNQVKVCVGKSLVNLRCKNNDDDDYDDVDDVTIQCATEIKET